MKLMLSISIICALFASCSQAPAFADKVNESAFERIQIGMSYEQVVMQLSGLEGTLKLEDPATGYAAYDWPNGDLTTTTYTISVAFSNQRVVGKAGTSYDEKGQVLQQVRYPN